MTRFSKDASGSEPAALFAAVASIVNALDPIGLLELGAPPDEYAPEIADLARLVSCGPFSQSDVDAVWVHWFSTSLADTGALGPMTSRLQVIQSDLRD